MPLVISGIMVFIANKPLKFILVTVSVKMDFSAASRAATRPWPPPFCPGDAPLSVIGESRMQWSGREINNTRNVVLIVLSFL